ncbi:MAG: hypothetical protein Fur0043_09550 [Anaerolineales bacterium]
MGSFSFGSRPPIGDGIRVLGQEPETPEGSFSFGSRPPIGDGIRVLGQEPETPVDFFVKFSNDNPRAQARGLSMPNFMEEKEVVYPAK